MSMVRVTSGISCSRPASSWRRRPRPAPSSPRSCLSRAHHPRALERRRGVDPAGRPRLRALLRKPHHYPAPASSSFTRRHQRDRDPAGLRRRAFREQAGATRRQPFPDHRFGMERLEELGKKTLWKGARRCCSRRCDSPTVIPALVAGIHVFFFPVARSRGWPGQAAMTESMTAWGSARRPAFRHRGHPSTRPAGCSG